MLIFYLLSVAKIILVLILNLFNLIDGTHQVDSPQARHCDANKEDEVHAWQACSPAPSRSTKEHGGGAPGGVARGGAHGGASGGQVGR